MTTEQYFFQLLARNRLPHVDATMLARQGEKWFRRQVLQLTAIQRQELLRTGRQIRILPNTALGKLYFFQYFPKHEKTLPWYDVFPLVVPLRITRSSFMGINLHYLPPMLRARVMDLLYRFLLMPNESKPLPPRARFRAIRQLPLLRPCYKQYLYTHVRSPFVDIPVPYWDVVAFLPLHLFRKASADLVWAHSARIALSPP